MGEIAEMMLDGTLDSETGEYLGPGPGYPRTMEMVELKRAANQRRRARKKAKAKAKAKAESSKP